MIMINELRNELAVSRKGKKYCTSKKILIRLHRNVSIIKITGGWQLRLWSYV